MEATWVSSSWGSNVEHTVLNGKPTYRLKGTNTTIQVDPELTYTEQGKIVEDWLKHHGVQV